MPRPTLVRARARDSTQSTPSGDPLVLIADDDEDTRDLYEAYLAISGLRTRTAADGPEVLRMIRAERPDVLILDMTMPLLDGWEVTRRLKGDPTTTGIFVIALTGAVAAESRARSKEAGCDAFLTKPCLPEHLLFAVLGSRQRYVL